MISMDMVSIFLTSITLLISTFLLYYKWRFTYWKNKKIPGPKPSMPFGNTQNIITRNMTGFEHIKQIYDQMKARNEKHCGIYTFMSPAYMPLDPEYIKNITCKDFNHFINRGMYHDEDNDPLSAHLLSLEDEKWKNLRAKLTPSFTSGKMKTMFNSFIICSNQMLGAMEKLAVKPIDIREICACYTTDVIGTCAFGLDCNSFQEEAEFRKYGKKAMHPSVQNVLRIIFCSSFSRLAKFFKTRLINAEVSKFFINAIRSTLKYREENGIIRNDFLEISLRLKQNNELTVEEIAAQAFIFFLAGFETSSTTMSCCIYELARNESIQEKLRDEIRNVLTKYDDKITYESIFEMKYLEQVIEETLRIYPPIPQIQRVCTKDYKLPGHDVILEKGTRIILPVFALHRDLEYYPEPEKFDPDRFNEENKSNRHSFAYLPFGEGPRICIGKRFGLMQVKVGLIALLMNYELKLNKNTKTPITFDRNGFLLTVQDTIWLDATKLNK